jgi:hypothetical protein
LDYQIPSLDRSDEPLSPSALQAGIGQIKDKLNLADFDYETVVSQLENRTELKNLYTNATNGYEKLRIYRLIDENRESSVIRKYINETYHVENDYISQLDPAEFDPIPQFVIGECDKFIVLAME